MKLIAKKPYSAPLAALLIASVASQALGQNIIMRGTDTLRAVVENVVDRRDTSKIRELTRRYYGECELLLKFEGGAITPETLLRRVRITNAIDSTGRNLLPTNRTFFPGEWPLYGGHTVIPPQQNITIKLQTPAREATTIRVAKGDVEFYIPNATNSNVLTFERITANEPLSHPLLKNLGIELTPIDRDRFTAEEKNRKKKTEKWEQYIDDTLVNTLSNVWHTPHFETNMLVMEIVDPKGMVALIELRKGDHRPFKYVRPIRWGDFVLFALDEPLPRDLNVRVHLALPEVIHRLPFRVEHVPLP